jgi:LVIVD repeat-containing protein
MSKIFCRVKAIHLRILMGISLFLASLTLPALAVDLEVQRVGSYDTSGSARGVAVSGNYAYVADYTAGLQVIDVSNPANPQRVGGNPAPNPAVGVGLSDSHVFVAANDRGLFILNHFTPGPVLSLASPSLEGSSLRVSVQGLPGLRVEVQRSGDLLNWQSWTNGVLGSSPLEFRDTDPNLRKFYRALAP